MRQAREKTVQAPAGVSDDAALVARALGGEGEA